MTVKELINELLECDMDSEINLRIKLNDMDLDYDSFEVDKEKTGGGWGRQQVILSVDLEHRRSDNFIDEV